MKSTRRTEFETGQPTLPQPQPENWNLVAVTKHSKWKNKFGKYSLEQHFKDTNISKFLIQNRISSYKFNSIICKLLLLRLSSTF